VQHLRDFGRFEMNKLDRGRQRDRILVAEEGVLYKIENQSQTVCSLAYLEGARLRSMSHLKSSGTKTRGFSFDVSFYALAHNYSIITLLFKPLLLF
jgi:hypothetical protein